MFEPTDEGVLAELVVAPRVNHRLGVAMPRLHLLLDDEGGGAHRPACERSNTEQTLARDRDLTERFGRSVEQLGSNDVVIRVGGVFAMERFALDAFAIAGAGRDIDWRMALDLLAAFARERSSALGDETPQAPADVVEAVRVLGRFSSRTGADEPVDIIYNLSGVCLVGATISNTYLHHADLRGADLTRARLGHAHLAGANLGRTKMSRSWLTGSNLVEADLYKADLRRAWLTGADLSRAHLREADLTGAGLINADLSGSHLVDATLSEAKLRDIKYTDDTTWPEGFQPPRSR